MSAAYASRLKTGKGQRVDTSLFEAGITQTFWQSAIAFATGVAPEPMGSAHPLNAPYQSIATKDGWINIGCANQANWQRMLDVIEAQSLADDDRFATNQQRMANREELINTLESIFVDRTTDEWVAALNDGGIPAGPILSIPQMHTDPQAQARDMIVEVDHPVAGTVKTLGTPVKFHGTPCGVRNAAPMIGQHSREVLREAGYSDKAIQTLIDTGALAAYD